MIAEYTASGKMLSADEVQKRDKEIKSEVIKSLQGHDLTIGQAINLLEECQSDLSATAYCHSL